MFGKNPIRPINRDPQKLAVTSHFYTIQGEGPYAGRPALFIRLAGCNLACHFCDTEFEKHADEPQTYQAVIAEIIQAYSKEQRKFVVLTGGEPLRQDPTKLIDMLLTYGTDLVQIETAGTVFPSGISDFIDRGRVVLVCSPKTPSIHPRVKDECHHWKYIVKAGEMSHLDGLPTMSTQILGKEQNLYRAEGGTVWLSPCDEYDPVKNKANQDEAVKLCLQYGYRLSLQMHKIIGVE